MKCYRKGADYERAIVNEFRKKGCIALRSAGSHSPIDVVVIDKELGEIKLIQAKKKKQKMSENERQKIITRGSELNGVYNVKFELWD